MAHGASGTTKQHGQHTPLASRCAAKRSWRSIRTEWAVVNAIDVFAGAGGLSLGATQAGVDVALAIERDEHAAAAHQANHPETEVLTADVSDLSSDDIRRVQQCNDGTVVFGGPPCQGFSYSNTKTRTTENTLNWLYKEFLRVIDAWQPICFVFENVRGITDFAKGAMLKTILRDFKRLGFIQAGLWRIERKRLRRTAGQEPLLPHRI